MFTIPNFTEYEILTFFCVLVRFSVMLSVIPFLGDRTIPVPVKILLSLAISVALFPVLVQHGQINPKDAVVWSATAGGIIKTVAQEAMFGLIVGFVARMVFNVIDVGGELIGFFMGFASASQFDPHQESQTQVISKLYMAFAMLLFLALDGHHLMLRAALDSYRIVGLGKLSIGGEFVPKMIAITGNVLKLGLQMAAPMAISFFAINVVYGVMAKAMPQLNILLLSFSVSALVGLFVIFLSFPEFSDLTHSVFAGLDDQMGSIMVAIGGR